MRSVLMLKRKNGFTLIELLVVISIIAVLMAVMIPALGRAKLAAQSVVCKTRLKDLGSMLYLIKTTLKVRFRQVIARRPNLNNGYSDGDCRWPSQLRTTTTFQNQKAASVQT